MRLAQQHTHARTHNRTITICYMLHRENLTKCAYETAISWQLHTLNETLYYFHIYKIQYI